MGFKIMIAGATPMVVFSAVKKAFEELRDKGIVSAELIGDSREVLEMLGLPAVYEMEQRYAVNDPEPES